MAAYYNEVDKYAAQWLKNLISAGHLPAGDVDDRSVADVQPGDLAGYSQCHLFAGIGGWPLALRLAGWADDRPVWSGSCPCQPFSNAGQQRGTEDERHLWPEFRRLITECEPPIIIGEQVASRLGREWLSGVRADLEALGYGVGAADLCAASAGSPHIRQRLFWLADSELGDAGASRLPPPEFEDLRGERWGREGRATAKSSPSCGFWSDAVWLQCLDGKARRVKSEIFPLADRVPARVGKLRAAGNAVVPQIAAEFISAFMDVN